MLPIVLITLIYTAASGLWGVVATDFVQYVLAMIGALLVMGYALHEGNRGRMIRLLILLLVECGWVRERGGAWEWAANDVSPQPEAGRGDLPPGESATGDPQYLFFRGCLDRFDGCFR